MYPVYHPGMSSMAFRSWEERDAAWNAIRRWDTIGEHDAAWEEHSLVLLRILGIALGQIRMQVQSIKGLKAAVDWELDKTRTPRKYRVQKEAFERHDAKHRCFHDWKKKLDQHLQQPARTSERALRAAATEDSEETDVTEFLAMAAQMEHSLALLGDEEEAVGDGLVGEALRMLECEGPQDEGPSESANYSDESDGTDLCTPLVDCSDDSDTSDASSSTPVGAQPLLVSQVLAGPVSQASPNERSSPFDFLIDFAPCFRADCPCEYAFNGQKGFYCCYTCRNGKPCSENYHDRPPKSPPAPPTTPAGAARCARSDCECVCSYNGLPGFFCCETCRDGTPCTACVHTVVQKRATKGRRM